MSSLINTGLPDLASGPFAPKGYGLKGQESIAQALAHARQLKRLNGSLKRRRRVGAQPRVELVEPWVVKKMRRS